MTTAAAGLCKLFLSSHSGSYSANEVNCPLDIHIHGLREHIKVEVRSDGTGNIPQLREVNMMYIDGQVRPQEPNKNTYSGTIYSGVNSTKFRDNTSDHLLHRGLIDHVHLDDEDRAMSISITRRTSLAVNRSFETPDHIIVLSESTAGSWGSRRSIAAGPPIPLGTFGF